jgi:hydroxyacylglutathione hydrolase
MNHPLPDWLVFWQRPFPSANTLLIKDEKPVLIDSGSGSDAAATIQWLDAVTSPPERLWLLINTHYHTDHVGGNFHVQTRSHVPIAAHRWEGQLINHRDPEACSARFLRQPVEPYHVDVLLEEGEELVLGKRVLRVLHTPGHTLGHICLYLPQDKILICGDAVHHDDVAWVNPFREGVGALARTMQSLERLAQLDVQLALSGHGPILLAPREAFDRARRRYEDWLEHPENAGWHACKRIFAYALMLNDGLARERVAAYLLSCPWFVDYSQHVFQAQPAAFVQPFLEEMLRSRAVHWNDEHLVATTAYTKPPEGWASSWMQPAQWPRTEVRRLPHL